MQQIFIHCSPISNAKNYIINLHNGDPSLCPIITCDQSNIMEKINAIDNKAIACICETNFTVPDSITWINKNRRKLSQAISLVCSEPPSISEYIKFLKSNISLIIVRENMYDLYLNANDYLKK